MNNWIILPLAAMFSTKSKVNTEGGTSKRFVKLVIREMNVSSAFKDS